MIRIIVSRKVHQGFHHWKSSIFKKVSELSNPEDLNEEYLVSLLPLVINTLSSSVM